MTTQVLFAPPAVNGTIAATSSSQRILLSGGGFSVLIKNLGPSEAFIAFGNATVNATAGGSSTSATDGSFSIPAGEVGTYRITTGTYIAAICSAGNTALLRISQGDGE